MKKKIIIFLLCLSLIYPYQIHADWVDDWLNNAFSSVNYSGPSSINLTTRQYYALGGGSLRWQTGNIHPISFQAPSIKFGCGGVDIFLGSLGLLDFDYLVSRGKNIMYAAGAFAFKYALAKMAPKVDQILTALQATANFLNQLQLDECRAGKAITAKLMSPFSDQAAADAATTKNLIDLVGGDSDSWQQAKDAWSKALGFGQASKHINSSDVKAMNSGCPGLFNNVTLENLLGKTFLQYLKDKGLISSNEFLKVIRSLIGDLKIDSNGVVYYITPCGVSSSDIVEEFLNNKLPVCSSIEKGSCSCSNNSNFGANKIKTIVSDAISDYLQALSSNTHAPSTSSSVISIIYYYPVYDFLKQAYMSQVPLNTVTSDTSNLVDCASYYYTAGLLANILYEAQYSINRLPAIYDTFCNNAKDIAKCRLCDSSLRNAMKDKINFFNQKIKDVLYNIIKADKMKEMLKSCTQLESVQVTLNEIDSIIKKVSY